MSTVPTGFRLVKDPSLAQYANGRVLVGGTPPRVLRLSEAGRKQAEELIRGERVTGATAALAGRLIDAGLAHPRPPAGAPVPSATIVIPVRDRPSHLEACLRAIRETDRVMVVDDGSEDAGAIATVCEAHGANLLRLPVSRGPSAARNAPLPDVHTDLVAFVDCDTAPERGWLERLARHFADPAVGAAAPRIRPLAPGTSLLQRYAAARSPLDMGPQDASVIPYGRVPYVPTATMVVRREALKGGGGFDEELHCAEDVDLVWRLHDAGWRVRYDPSVVVRHDEPASWREYLRRHRWYGEWSGPLSRRHPGRLAHLVIAPLPGASGMLLLLHRPRAAFLLAAIQAVILARDLENSGLPTYTSWAWTTKWVGLTMVGFGRAATIFAAPGLIAILVPQRTRTAAAALLLALPAAEYIARRPRMNPLCWLAACVADEFAYGIGVWKGCALARTAGPLRPLWVTGTSVRGIKPPARGSGMGSLSMRRLHPFPLAAKVLALCGWRRSRS